MTQVKESGKYENCLDILNTTLTQGTLAEFVDDEFKEDLNGTSVDHWKKHWIGMPSFVQEDDAPFKKIYISFRNEDDYDEFAKLINQNLSDKTKSIWYPKLERDENTLKRWIE